MNNYGNVEIKIVDLQRHSHNIYKFLLYYNPYDQNTVNSWFYLASGIEYVHFLSDKYDDYVQWCGSAIEYENHRSKFHSDLILNLTRFNYIWGGLEAFIDSFDFPNCPSRSGKINKVNYYLKINFLENYEMIEFYKETVYYLKKLLSLNSWYLNDSEINSISECECKELIGLKIVYKIRNLFAHGSLKFSEPDGWHHTTPYDNEIIITSTRLVLFTLQMLFISVYDDLNFKIPKRLHDRIEKGAKASDFLFSMHLKSYKYN
ncbi:hypothetical protein SAMN05216480_12018 [Pustulibacterium marinum]|uniref:Uncharacterized protein n=1 Tax=Pustulibacterium marinum TaxID=1224947 RepID=A0A1I7IRF5_9FLAO|nr:hypothetical protein [Pustulibacterium marinum]SFU75506.1 hypothetical protein SAMN05216480_12018 [Pustulibacterium marinum]